MPGDESDGSCEDVKLALSPHSPLNMVDTTSRIKRLEEVLKEKQLRLEEVNSFWGARSKAISVQLRRATDQLEVTERKLSFLGFSSQRNLNDTAAGPDWLRWVDGTTFSLITAFVILVNLVTMCVRLGRTDESPQESDDFAVIDGFILSFYIVELALRSSLHQKAFFIGDANRVWRNWVDVAVVVSGIMDLWLKPLVFKDSGPSYLAYLQIFRAARLSKILYVLHDFFGGDLSWAETTKFQSFMMIVIFFNAIIIGFETDLPNFGGWYYVEQGLISLFFFELMVRLKHWGPKFFYHPDDWWMNWVDLVIVISGVVDMWILPLLGSLSSFFDHSLPSSENHLQGMVVLRLLRLLRILRVIRLIRDVPPLFLLLKGIIQSLQGIGWVTVLTFLVLYTFALLTTRLIGHGLLMPSDVPDDVLEVFPTVPESMFVLFKVMNGDTSPLSSLFDLEPWTKVGCAGFMILSNWAILAILTAVVSENLINASEAHRAEFQEQERENAQDRTRKKLTKIFDGLDVSGEGYVSRSEFNKLLEDEGKVKNLCKVSHKDKEDIQELFRIVSRVRTPGSEPVMSHRDFIEALQIEAKEVSERSMMRLHRRLEALEEIIKRALT